MKETPETRGTDKPDEDGDKIKQEFPLLGNFASRDEQTWWEEHIIFE